MRQDTPAKSRKEQLIDEAIELFQPMSPTPLTREDGREIFDNLTGFFMTLIAIKKDMDAAMAAEGGAQ